MSKTKTNAELLNTPASTSQKPFDTEDFLARNGKLFMWIGLVAVALVGLYYAYSYFAGQQEDEAQKDLFAPVTFLEADSIRLALKGNKTYRGLEQIIKDYPNTKAGNLARFYAGAAYLKEGAAAGKKESFQKAIEVLKQYSAGDYLTQPRAYCMLGDAYLELNKLDDALTYYSKAATYQANEQFTPVYLHKLALVYELQKKYKEAMEAYDRIIKEFPTANTEATNAKKFKARLEGILVK
jgi:tetratricopeptide (TPR) repeat protein